MPLFADAPEEQVPGPLCAATREGCYSNAVLVADLDDDGDLDAVFANGGGYYVRGDAEPLSVWQNDGTGHFTEIGPPEFARDGRVRQVTAGDVDGDGDLDLFVPDAWAMQADSLFIRGPSGWSDEGDARIGTSSRAGAARFFDADGDLDVDLAVSDWGDAPPASPGVAHLYLNDGAGTFTEASGAFPEDLSDIGTGPIDLDAFDADGDWDLDVLIASREGDSLLLRNDGAGVFTNDDAGLAEQPGPYVYGPDICDVDGDLDLDLWLDNGGDGLLEQLLINDAGSFVDASDQVTNNPDADDNEVQCADLDGDGDFDAIVASLSDNERALINDGGSFTGLDDAFPQRRDGTLGLDLGDVDGDGRLDAITAQGETGPSFVDRLYLGTLDQPVDVLAPQIRAVRALPDAVEAGPQTFEFAVSDGATSDVGPRVKAWIELGGEPIPARFRGGDLFAATFEVDADFEWIACAEDMHGNIGCGPEQEVVVEPKACGCASGSIDASWLVGLIAAAGVGSRRRRCL